MPQINFTPPGADGPLASLEVGAKYDTTYFPSDLSEAPYFIVFRAQNKYKMSELGTVKTKFPGIVDYALDSILPTPNPDDFVGALSQQQQQSIALKAGLGSSSAASVLNSQSGGREPGLLSTVISAVGGFAKALEGIGVELSQPAHSFALPIPSNLSTQYNAQYSGGGTPLGAGGDITRRLAENFQATENGFISDLQAATAQAQINSDDLSGALAAGGISALEGLSGTAAGAGIGALLSRLGAVGTGVGALTGSALGELGTGILRGAGVARNPHIANIFTGVNFRNHNFSYKLVAKNKQESDTIRDLIRNFKYHMAPDYRAGDHVFTYPSQFQIIIRAGDYLFKIADSVLTTFDVNYTGEGAPYFFEDTNAPYSVTINMSFTEDTIVTKREVRAGR